MLYVSLCFDSATKNSLGCAHKSMGLGQVAIQRQRVLAFGDAFRYVSNAIYHSETKAGQGMAWRQGKCLCHRSFGSKQTCLEVVNDEKTGASQVNPSDARQCIDVLGINFQGTFEKHACLRNMGGVKPRFKRAMP